VKLGTDQTDPTDPTDHEYASRIGVDKMALSRIGVMTSGGDAPGMNAAVRAAARMGRHLGLDVVGIEDGYQGLLESRIVPIDSQQLEGIQRIGGTILGTSRSPEFRTLEGQQKGLNILREHGIEGLVVIGGEGSFKGAFALNQLGFPVIGVPASIDNDVGGTDVSIGVDTAINTALEAIDKLKDTASAFHRAFVVEVMGRSSGWIALQSAIAAGAEMVLIPEVSFQLEDVVRRMQAMKASGRSHFLLVAAEGISPTATEISAAIAERDDIGFESRLTVLGHIQRGGSPTAFDRLLAARLAAKATEELAAGRPGTVIGLRNMQMITTPIDTAVNQPHHYNPETYRFAEILAG
jgi:6-phosphofructokinase 1